MKHIALLALALSTSCVQTHAQGQLNFNNFVAAGTPYAAPIYGPEPAANGGPIVALHGQGAANLSNPMGSTVYHGAPLAGTGFTAQLWAGPSAGALAAPDAGTGTRSFSTVAALAGYLSSGVTAQYAAIAPGSTAQTLQVRAWDNRGGTITSWAQVMQDPSIPRGLSIMFSSPTFTAAPTPPGVTPGMTSFNLVVPEPSLIALGAFGLGALLLRRRK